MKTFKSFIKEAGPNAKPKAKGEADFVDAHKVEISDPEDQATDGSAKVITKDGSGKRKADRLDNKQAMGEDTGQADARKTTPSSKEAQQKVFDKHKERMKQLAKEELETSVQPKTYREMMREADFSKKQTTMAHTIGKEFEKKGVGDETKGGPYAVASAMVRDRPEAAKKAYATIKSKMKEEADAELLFKLYDDLNEENQEFFMQQLEEDAEALLLFAQNLMEE